MPKFVTQNGESVECTDPRRAVWYGQCGYWCDDWDTLVKVGPGIPACPHCKTPGFITSAESWFTGAANFASTADNGGYVEYLNANKGKCYRNHLGGFMGAWKAAKVERDLTKMKIIPDGFTLPDKDKPQ